MARPLQRPVSVGLILALALALSVISPKPAHAHDSCAVAQPAASGLLGAVLGAVNVFSSFLPAEAACEDKFADVDVKLTRDWGADAASAEAASGPTFNAGKANERSNAPATFAPCKDGMAAGFFPCDGVDMLSHVSHAELGTTFVNDIWGWTDPQTRKDYALVGSSDGTVFVDITDAKRPQVQGILPTASTNGGSTWRDIKVYEDHAYVVSEHTNHGVQVIDLTKLRDWDGTYTTYEADARYTGHGSAHNININEDTGFLYSMGAGPFSESEFPNTVTIDAPSSAAGEYGATGAAFGPAPTAAALTGSLTTVGEACDPIAALPAGTIAIADRGACAFTIKVKNAQDAGAVAVIVANNQPGSPITMGGGDDSITIPSVMVSQADGDTIKAGLPATGGITANPQVNHCGTGLHMIDINEPKNPTHAGCFDDHGYVHDTQCVVYDGPDADFQGRELCFNSNATTSAAGGEHRVAIVDVTDKSNPVSLSREGYPNDGYSHQGWLTEDQRFFLHGDELDEVRRGINTTTRLWNVEDPANPELVQTFTNDNTSIDHNIYTQGDFAYASNYTSGLRVYGVDDLENTGLHEVAYFDLYPENDATAFEGGAWSSYPYFRQKGVVAVSSIDRGLFILQPRLSRSGG